MEMEHALEEWIFPRRETQMSYIPEVEDDMKPKVGQQFKSLDDTYMCYNSYAYKAGFSVRKGKETKKNGVIHWKEFICSKEGETDETWRKKKEKECTLEKRERGNTRTCCQAKLTVGYDGSNYVVKTFIEEHSHPPTTPSRVHLLRSHRSVSAAKKNLIQDLRSVDIPIYQQFEILETQAGGHENVGCTERDLRNSLRDDREKVKSHDVEILYEHFKSEQENDPEFYFEFHTDEDKRLIRCFWVDSIAKKEYSYFGDVVVFDTTYNTNRYRMIFAPIVGVNHHGQTTIFGCAFLSDETFDSFIWLLKTWLGAMPRGAPNVIITDQDQAMTKAIAHILPNTFHRYCVWHIMKKFQDKTSAIFMRDYYELFKACIWNSESPEEFENRWFEALEKSQQTSNEWFKKMFELRSTWIPAYVNKYFSAGMSSSQRVESAHAFFKRYCDKENSLMDFVTRFNRALAHQRHEELIEDHRDLNETPNLRLGMPMETQMAHLYTKKYFQYFQTQLYDSNGYILYVESEEDNCCLYKTQRVLAENSRMRTLVHDKVSNIVKCSCKMFDFEGIPCRHILAFFRVKQIMQLPKEYILRRWTRFSRVRKERYKVQDGADNSLIMRHTGMFKLASTLIDEAAISPDGTAIVQKAFEGLIGQIKKLNLSSGETSSVNNSTIEISEENRFLDPSQVRAKGCGKRIPSWRDRKGKDRHCSVCRSTGHTKKKCPQLVSLGAVENKVDEALGDQETTNDEL